LKILYGIHVQGGRDLGLTESIISETIGFIKSGRKIKANDKLIDKEERYASARAYREAVGIARYGAFIDLSLITDRIYQYFEKEHKDKSEEELKEEKKYICELLENMEMTGYDNYHPYEIPIMFDLKMLIKKLER